MFARHRSVALVLIAVVSMAAQRSVATLYLYEPFNYAAGQGLAGVDGQVGFGGNSGNTAQSVVPSPQGGQGSPYGQQAPNGNYWMTGGYNNNSPYSQANDAVTHATDLSVTGLADPVTGGSIQLGGGGSSPRIAFTPTSNSADGSTVSVYYSLLLQINDMSQTSAANGGLIGGFNNIRGSQGNNPSTVGASLWAKASGEGFVLGVAEQDSTALGRATYDTNVLSFGQTYLVVGKYNINGTLNTGGTNSTSDDTAQIWINPDSSTFGGSDPASPLIASLNNIDVPTNQTDPAGGNPVIQSFMFRQDGAVGSNAPTDYLIDDLRIGTTYADVTPVPVIGVEGDYNGNGTVDAADYVLWRKGGPLQNEVDTPGTVNDADYTEWRARFGNGASGAGVALDSTSVPEPATIILFASFVVFFCCRRQLR